MIRRLQNWLLDESDSYRHGSFVAASDGMVELAASLIDLAIVRRGQADSLDIVTAETVDASGGAS